MWRQAHKVLSVYSHTRVKAQRLTGKQKQGSRLHQEHPLQDADLQDADLELAQCGNTNKNHNWLLITHLCPYGKEMSYKRNRDKLHASRLERQNIYRHIVPQRSCLSSSWLATFNTGCQTVAYGQPDIYGGDHDIFISDL